MLWMNKQKTINRQIVSWKFLFEAHKFTIKNNSRNTDWIVDLFPQGKSAEHMAKINTLNYLSQIRRISQFILKTLSQIYKTSMKHFIST